MRGWSRAVMAVVLCAVSLTVSVSTEAANKSNKARSSTRGSSAARGPDVRSNAVLVMDRNDGAVVYSRKADQIAPIASITKLMTSLVVLDAKLPMDEIIEVSKDDAAHTKGNFSRLAVGTKLTRADLMHLALMSSENRAAHALGRSFPGGEPAFVRAMNAKADLLGMTQSRFVDPSGLSSQNVSSAKDLAKLVIAASRSPSIREYSTSTGLEVKVGRQMLQFRNTNSLVRSPAWDITVQKTGFINEAGQCLVMQAQIDDRPVVIVLLNSYGKYTRVADAKRIRQWMEAQHTRSLARVTSSSTTAR